MEKLKSKLRELKLAGMVKSLESRNKYALEKKHRTSSSSNYL